MIEKQLRRRGIRPHIARRRTPHGSGLGKYRWYVERTLSWLHNFGRLRVRKDKSPEIHQAFLRLANALICLRILCRGSQGPVARMAGRHAANRRLTDRVKETGRRQRRPVRYRLGNSIGRISKPISLACSRQAAPERRS